MHKIPPPVVAASPVAFVRCKANKGCYQKLILEQVPEKVKSSISMDCQRTMLDHVLFPEGGEGEQTLYRVLQAWAVYRPETGYCQVWCAPACGGCGGVDGGGARCARRDIWGGPRPTSLAPTPEGFRVSHRLVPPPPFV